MHWTAAWLGRAWVEGAHDCVDFFEEVQRVRFGRVVQLPQHAASERAWDRQIARERDRLGVRTDTPQEGDGVLMRGCGGVRRRYWHLGVYVAGPEPLVLHLPRDGHSILHPVRELEERCGLELEGYYRWK